MLRRLKLVALPPSAYNDQRYKCWRLRDPGKARALWNCPSRCDQPIWSCYSNCRLHCQCDLFAILSLDHSQASESPATTAPEWFDLDQCSTHASVVCSHERNSAGLHMRHIVVATDGSADANRAVDVAAELAKAFGAKLFIVTVAGNLSGEETQKLARIEENIGSALEALSMQIVTTAETRVRHLGVTNVQLHIEWGDAARSIIEIAAGEAADAIVLGRRGRGRLTGLPLGSVCQKVVSLAPCTVIVVPELAERSPDDAPWSWLSQALPHRPGDAAVAQI
jgi:nucleotide-binding universal stress UspA family protein